MYIFLLVSGSLEMGQTFWSRQVLPVESFQPVKFISSSRFNGFLHASDARAYLETKNKFIFL